MDFESKQKIGIIIQKHILSTKIGYVIEQMVANKRKCEPITETTSDNNKVVYIESTEIDKIISESEPVISTKEITAIDIRDREP